MTGVCSSRSLTFGLFPRVLHRRAGGVLLRALVFTRLWPWSPPVCRRGWCARSHRRRHASTPRCASGAGESHPCHRQHLLRDGCDGPGSQGGGCRGWGHQRHSRRHARSLRGCCRVIERERCHRQRGLCRRRGGPHSQAGGACAQQLPEAGVRSRARLQRASHRSPTTCPPLGRASTREIATLHA